jgi:hypothetical protein
VVPEVAVAVVLVVAVVAADEERGW